MDPLCAHCHPSQVDVSEPLLLETYCVVEHGTQQIIASDLNQVINDWMLWDISFISTF